MAKSSKPNKNYEQEMILFKRAWVCGTNEYQFRISYPGHVPQCSEDGCINSIQNRTSECYWLCDACIKLVPDNREYNIHAPTKNYIPTQKALKHSMFTFIAHLQNKIGKNPYCEEQGSIT